jgi:aspartyl-tRNA(Asn)/glutamyl-tRNA(Gln) amidotransferase subunit C
MSKFNEQTVSNLEKLCRIQCTPEEEKDILNSLSRILEYVDLINEVDLTDVPTCNFVLKEMVKRELREDEVKDLMSSEQFLANAPDRIGGMIRVPPVMKTL